MYPTQSIDPRRIAILEVMTLPLSAVASRLDEFAIGFPNYLAEYSARHSPYDADVLITPSQAGYRVTVHEPGNGIPRLQSFPGNPTADQQQLEWFIEGLQVRNDLLARIVTHLFEEFPTFPSLELSQITTMANIASACDISITDVSRLLIDKTMRTPSGCVPMIEVIARTRKK